MQLSNIIDILKKSKHAWPFMESVNKDEVPDYYDIIKDPMDIKTIERNIQNNFYKNKESFITDL